MNTNKYTIAVIGCGRISNNAHFPALSGMDNVRIKYACDLIPEKAEDKVARFGAEQAITDYKTALDDPEVEAVWVLTPNYAHYTVTMDALKAGKHVFCEKPITVNYDLSCKMAKEAKKQGKLLNIGVCNRYHKTVEMLEEMNRRGDFGRIYHVYCSFRSHRSIPGLGGAFTDKSQSGGGVLIDWGVHRIDLVMYCLGDPQPLAVCGKAFSKLGCDIPNYLYRGMWSEETRNVNGTYDVDDSVTAFIRTEGPIISLEGAWAQNIEPEENYIDFIGTEGGIRLVYGGGFSEYKVASKTFISEEAKFDRGDMFLNEIQSFIHSVKTGEKIQSHIDYAILTSKIMQGIYDSSDSGKEIVF